MKLVGRVPALASFRAPGLGRDPWRKPGIMQSYKYNAEQNSTEGTFFLGL
jgi:hypothetical protein